MSYKFFNGRNTRQNGPAARRAPSPEVLEDADDDFYIQAGDLLDPRPASPVQQRSSLPNIISPSVQRGPTAPQLLSPPTQRASSPEVMDDAEDDFYLRAGDLLAPTPVSPVPQRPSSPNIISPLVQRAPTPPPRILSPSVRRSPTAQLLAPLRNEASAIQSVNEDVCALMDPE